MRKPVLLHIRWGRKWGLTPSMKGRMPLRPPPRGERRIIMSTATPAPTPPPATSPPTAPPPKPSRFGKWAGFLIVTGFLLVGWLILAMFRHNVSYTEWPLYIILSMIGFGLSFTTKARMNKFIPFAIGGFLLVVAIMMATPWPFFDGDWHLAKWASLALVAIALLLAFFKKWLVAALAGALALALVTGVVAPSWRVEPLNLSADTKPTTPSATTSAPTTQATTASPTTTSPTPQVCTYGKADGWVENPEFKIDVRGLPVGREREKLLEYIGDNHILVYGLAKDYGLNPPPEKSLRDGVCWTKPGYDLSRQVYGIVASSSWKIGQAPKDAINTGSYKGRFVRNKTPGITGDRRAIILTHQDGITIESIMARCVNLTPKDAAVDVPVGPTDETPQSKPSTPGTSSPPATDTPTLAPKNPGVEPGPMLPSIGGKAPAPAPTASAPAVPRPDPTSAYTPQPPPPPVATAPGTTSRPTDLPAPVPGAPTAPGSPRTTAPPPTWPGN